MAKLITISLRYLLQPAQLVRRSLEHIASGFSFALNGVDIESYSVGGVPFIRVARSGTCRIGKNFRINSSIASNPIGRNSRSVIFVGPEAELEIGDNVGMSGSAIVCHRNIVIGNNVKIGGNVVIYDTDFHSLDVSERINRTTDIEGTKSAAVVISDNVFIGAHTTILKGTTIGRNSIVGAASLVSSDIPENEIWAGSPARKIRSI